MALKDMRRAKGWSQDQLAEISGVSVRTIQRLEKGELPALETQKAIAAAFEQTMEEFAKSIGDNSSPDDTATGSAITRLGWKGLLGNLGTMMVVITWLFFLSREFGLHSAVVYFVGYMWAMALLGHVVHLATHDK